MSAGAVLVAMLVFGCGTTLPEPKHKVFDFPKAQAFVGDVSRKYEKLGLVRSKAEWQSLDPTHEEESLCKNYYNKAAIDLVKMARDHGGEAVIDVRSVTLLEDGRWETHQTAECSDDGEEGQVLLQGIAVKWVREPKPMAATPAPANAKPVRAPAPVAVPVPVPTSSDLPAR